jgi:hypothetical protein
MNTLLGNYLWKLKGSNEALDLTGGVITVAVLA